MKGIAVKSYVNWIGAHNFIWVVVILAVFAALPSLVGLSWTSLVSEMLILAVAACGVNILMGYTGLVTFGPAGLYGLGAYITALLIMKADINFGLAVIAGPVLTAIVSIVIGWFCVRRTAVYFAVLSLAFSQIIYTVIFKWYSFTGGDDGIVGIPVPDWFSSITNYYYFTLAMVAIYLVLLWMIVQSPFGSALRSIRENPRRAEAIGIKVKRYQLISFIIQGFFLGAAGSLFTGFNRNVFPIYADPHKTNEILVACLLGGMHHFFGPVVGAIIYVLLSKVLVIYTEYWLLILGIIVVLAVLFLRGGILGFATEKLPPIMAKGE